MVIITDSNYEPFLKARFPLGRWIWVHPNDSHQKSGLLLGLIPCRNEASVPLTRWSEAALVLQKVKKLHLYWQRYQSQDVIFEHLFHHYPQFEKDRFLESVFWDEIAVFFNSQKDLPGAWACYQKALQLGYPAASFYNEIGALLAIRGSRAAAKEYFQAAIRAPVNRTSAFENLQTMEESLNRKIP